MIGGKCEVPNYQTIRKLPFIPKETELDQLLGHKNINNTLVYTQLVNFDDDNYTVRVAHNVDEDKQLIEAGFEYVTEGDGFKIYRKRK